MVHFVSRVVQKRRLLDSSGMEEMLRILRTQAEFAGIEVLTYCFLENHFHILALVDGREEVVEAIDDAELAACRTYEDSTCSMGFAGVTIFQE